MSWTTTLRCPVCGDALEQRRPRAVRQDQPGLAPGWDCPQDHALETSPAAYRRAQMERLTAEIQAMLAEPAGTVDLTAPSAPVDLTDGSRVPAQGRVESAEHE